MPLVTSSQKSMILTTTIRMSISLLPLLAKTIGRIFYLEPVVGADGRKLQSLLNALLDEAHFPISVVPLAAIPAYSYPSSIPRTIIVYGGGRFSATSRLPLTCRQREGRATTVAALDDWAAVARAIGWFQAWLQSVVEGVDMGLWPACAGTQTGAPQRLKMMRLASSF